MSRAVQGWVDNDIHPPTLGLAVRVYHLYRALARHRPVHVTCAVKRRDRGPAREVVDGLRLSRVKLYHPALFHYLERARLAPLFLAHRAHRRWPARLLGSADPEAAIWQFDSLPLCALYDRAPRGVRRVYASQNVEAEWFERVGPPLLRRRRWARALEDMERDAVQGADLTVAVSADDREEFIRRYGAKPDRVVVVENGFDPETLRPATAQERDEARAYLGLGTETALLFLGSDFPHNREAVEEIFLHLVPRLAERNAVLYLVGGVARRYAERASAAPGSRVRCVPPRPDVATYLRAADVGLNPVLRGAGSNVKVPTYLGAGLAVLSTPFGVRGYERLAPFVTVAETTEFADRLRDTVRREKAPREAVLAYGWDRLAARLAAAYDALGRADLAAPAERASCAS